ncbi:hypothetical protein HK098_000780 [Nowakowskiella sp. JEL0407]|nr:hypothetical protein HK098_000780 [Nowakowskiella sp. JEL0407]
MSSSTDETVPLLSHGSSETQTSKRWFTTTQKPTIFSIVPFLLLFTFFGGLVIVPTQQLFLRIVCRDIMHFETPYSDNLPPFAICAQNATVQAATAEWTVRFSTSASLPGLLSVPILISMSDRIGRVPILKLVVFSSLIGCLAVLAVAKLNLSLWWLVGVNMLQGIIGPGSASLMTIFAYISDCTRSADRTTSFAGIESLVFLSFSIAPFTGSLIVKLTDSLLSPFYVSFCGVLVAFAYLFLILPESLSPAIQKKQGNSAEDDSISGSQKIESPQTVISNIFGDLLRTLSIFTAPSRRSHLFIVILFFALYLCFSAMSYCYILYTAYRFGWESYEDGQFLLFAAAVRIMYMGGVLPFVLRVFSKPFVGKPNENMERTKLEVKIVRIALLMTAIGYIGLALATKSWMFFAIAFADGFGTAALPTARGLISRSTPSHLQGKLFSFLGFVEEVAKVTSPVIFGYIYSNSVLMGYPNIIFGAVTLVYVFAFLILFGWHDKNGDMKGWFDLRKFVIEDERYAFKDMIGNEQPDDGREEEVEINVA